MERPVLRGEGAVLRMHGARWQLGGAGQVRVP